jgi:hypothetical protein
MGESQWNGASRCRVQPMEPFLEERIEPASLPAHWAMRWVRIMRMELRERRR